MSTKQNPDRGTNATGAPEEFSTSILADLDDKARVVGGAFVVVVETTGDRHRRRPYLTAAAAERAARNAQKRGQNARVYLAELTPLYRVRGWEL